MRYWEGGMNAPQLFVVVTCYMVGVDEQCKWLKGKESKDHDRSESKESEEMMRYSHRTEKVTVLV